MLAAMPPLVEGPSGRGKSVIMDSLLTHVQQQANHPVPRVITAGKSALTSLRRAIQGSQVKKGKC